MTHKEGLEILMKLTGPMKEYKGDHHIVDALIAIGAGYVPNVMNRTIDSIIDYLEAMDRGEAY